MKRIILAVIFGVASLSSISTKAQVSLSINIGSQPQWGPTGYDHVDYYYLPDVDAYYNVPAKQYVYLNNGSWVWRSSLPSRYSGFDLYNSYKVVMNTPKPYLSHQSHLSQYSKYKGYKGKQGNIRDSRDTKYVNARNNGGRGNTPGRNNTPVRNNTPSRNNTPGRNNAPGNNGGHAPGNNGNQNNNGKGNDNHQDNKGGRGH